MYLCVYKIKSNIKVTTNDNRESFRVDICTKRSKDRTRICTVTNGDDVDATSACSHRFTPSCSCIVRVPVRQDHQVVGHVRSVSVSRLEHHVCREATIYTHSLQVARQVSISVVYLYLNRRRPIATLHISHTVRLVKISFTQKFIQKQGTNNLCN